MPTNPERIATIKRTRAELARRFPHALTAKDSGKRKHPLKLDIHLDLLAACGDLPVADVMAALGDYVSSPSYLRNCILGAARIDLRGKPVGKVSEAHMRYAFNRLMAAEARRRPPQKIGKLAETRTHPSQIPASARA